MTANAIDSIKSADFISPQQAVEVLKDLVGQYDKFLNNFPDSNVYAMKSERDALGLAITVLEKQERLKSKYEKEYDDATRIVNNNKNRKEYGKQIIAIMFQERREIIKEVLGELK